MTSFDLDEYLSMERGRVEAALGPRLEEAAAALGHQAGPAMTAGLLGGGKRLRPVLCVTAYRAVSGEQTELPGAVVDLAISLEMIHAYSLMHDDLPCMDDAPLRRGTPTPHTLFGVETTLREGAALIPAAVWSAWESGLRLGGADVARSLAAVLATAAGAGGMVGGQAVDLEAEGHGLDEAALTRLHGMKTGALLRASLEMGAIAAKAPPRTLEAMRAYGTAIGLAFQIADDVLDRTGTAESLGKNPSDEALDKSTFVALLGIEGARSRGLEVVSQAKAALESADVQSAALEALADYILSRAR